LGEGARELELVGRVHVQGCCLRRETMLRQVEGNDWFPWAMYSIILIMVERSLKGFDGSGSTQMSALAMYRSRSASDTQPVNQT
jgi:hypothetical protein